MRPYLKAAGEDPDKALQLYLWNTRLASACFETVRRRVRDLRRETRDQIIAGLSFGFWANLLHSDHEQMWRECLNQAFPGSSGHREDVAAVVEPLRVFRNRLAHHDSLLSINVIFQHDQLLRLAGWVDPAAAALAWGLYQTTHVYVCQAGRAVRVCDYLAFYADREIKPEVPKVLGR